MGWIQPQLIPPTKQKIERTHSHNQTSEELESSLKRGLKSFQPTNPATKHTVGAQRSFVLVAPSAQ